MTTMSYCLNLNDTQAITLKRALEDRLKLSEEMILAGKGAPYHADVMSAKAILEILKSNVAQVSGSYVDGSGESVIWAALPPGES